MNCVFGLLQNGQVFDVQFVPQKKQWKHGGVRKKAPTRRFVIPNSHIFQANKIISGAPCDRSQYPLSY